jgi:hypothetical protein
MKIKYSARFSEAETIVLAQLADKLMRQFLAREERSQGPLPASSTPWPASPGEGWAWATADVDYDVAPVRPSAVNPAPAPVAPAAPVEDAADAAELAHLKLIEEGTRAWVSVVRTWASNFEVEDAPQPDRASALMAVFSGYPRAVNAYIRERGGLAGACIDTLARENITAPDAAEKIGRRMALNMVQVGTAIGLPVDHLIEKSLLRRDDPDTIPLHGGLLGDTVDMTRPEYK